MRCLAVLICMLWGAVTPALCQTYEVTGVASSDSLNIRADVDQVLKSSQAKVIGQIPHNGKGITTTGISIRLDDGSRWREIIHKGVKGWVNARYLEEVGGQGLPVSLNCSGTEPFWELKIRGDQARLQDFGADPPNTNYDILDKRYGQNRGGLWSYHLATDDRKSRLTAIVRLTDQCSPGMGELEYAMEIFLLGPRPDAGPAQGCCSFER